MLTGFVSTGLRRSITSRSALAPSTYLSKPASAIFTEQLTPTVELDLDASEQELFSILNTVANLNGSKTTLRVAGGWVRDRLLSMQNAGPVMLGGLDDVAGLGEPTVSSITNRSDIKLDIDIALDDQLGSEFALKVSQWLKSQGEEETCSGVATISKNPDKSKHLETATMNIRGFSVDFVNLRTEEYCDQSSRIPRMKIGTPLEDASRRDLTINSMFYNLRTGAVEDLTGLGLKHLSQRLVATPLQPKLTLLDDPLRLLRAVRFATRLGFTLSEELLEAAADEEVQRALQEKVSRERIGHEFDLMMSTRPDDLDQPLKGPVRAVRLLLVLGAAGIALREPQGLYRTVQTTAAAAANAANAAASGQERPLPGSPEPAERYEAVPGVGTAAAAVRLERALQAVECADAVLRHSRHGLLRHTLGMDSGLEVAPGTPCQAFAGSGKVAAALSVDAERRVVLYSCLLLPWAHLSTSKAESKGKPPPAAPPKPGGAVVPATRYVVHEALKLRTKDADHAAAVHDASKRFQELLLPTATATAAAAEATTTANRRSAAGRALRVVGPLWRAAVVAAIVQATHLPPEGAEEEGCDRAEAAEQELVATRPPARSICDVVQVANSGASPVGDILCASVTREMQASAMFASLVKWMDEEGLLGDTVSIHRALATGRPSLAAWEMNPLLDGHQVSQLLPRLPRGPGMRDVMGSMLEWQLHDTEVYNAVAQFQHQATGTARPASSETTRIEVLCEEYLRRKFPQYT